MWTAATVSGSFTICALYSWGYSYVATHLSNNIQKHSPANPEPSSVCVKSWHSAEFWLHTMWLQLIGQFACSHSTECCCIQRRCSSYWQDWAIILALSTVGIFILFLLSLSSQKYILCKVFILHKFSMAESNQDYIHNHSPPFSFQWHLRKMSWKAPYKWWTHLPVRMVKVISERLTLLIYGRQFYLRQLHRFQNVP